MAITVSKYDPTTNMFTCKALIQANRPVFNASYTTTLYNNTDKDFNFKYAQFDQLEFKDEMVDNALTAVLAYYAYLIIGLNLDKPFPLWAAKMYCKLCMNLANNAQNLDVTGWKGFRQ